MRLAELQVSGRILGASRVEWLGYGDSGMEDEPTNGHTDCFWQADVDSAAERLAEILRAEQADVLTVYDEHGGYGHPDHIQVHRVGHRAAELAGTPLVYEATMNRDRMRALADFAFDGADLDPDLAQQREEMRATEMGSPAAEIESVHAAGKGTSIAAPPNSSTAGTHSGASRSRSPVAASRIGGVAAAERAGERQASTDAPVATSSAPRAVAASTDSWGCQPPMGVPSGWVRVMAE